MMDKWDAFVYGLVIICVTILLGAIIYTSDDKVLSCGRNSVPVVKTVDNSGSWQGTEYICAAK